MLAMLCPCTYTSGGEKMEKKQELKQTKDKAYSAYNGISRNYKQKLLYNLLSAVRSKDRNRFFQIIDQNINGIINTEDQKKFAYQLSQEYENLQGPQFESYAYAIITGILASHDPKDKNQVEDEEK